MPDLTFTIKTPAELAGAVAAAKAMEVNIGKAKALGQEYAAIEQRLNTTKASIAQYKSGLDEAGKGTAELAAHTEEAGQKAKLFEGHTKELKKTIRELSHEFPIAGAALRAFANPIGAALTLGIAAFVAVKRHIDSLNESLDKMEESARAPLANFKTALQEIQRASQEKLTGKAFENFNLAVAGIGRNCDAAIAKIKLLEAAQKEVFGSEEEKKLAEVKRAEALGKAGYAGGISGEEAATRREAIKNEYAAKQKMLADDAAAAGIKEQERALAATEAKRGEAQGLIISPAQKDAIEARIKMVEGTGRDFARDPLTGKAVGKELISREEAAAKAEAEVENRKFRFEQASRVGVLETTKGKALREEVMAEAEKKLKQAETEARTARERVASGDRFYESSLRNTDLKKAQLRGSDTAEKTVADLAEKIQQLTAELEKSRLGQTLEKTAGREREGNKSAARAAEASAEALTKEAEERKRAEQETKRRGKAAIEQNKTDFKGKAGEESASLDAGFNAVAEAFAAGQAATLNQVNAKLAALAQGISSASSRNQNSLLG